jgi:P27 family predicted phage terminase small subunit
MGRRGPKPKPTAFKIAAGVRSDRINFAEPAPVEGEIEPTLDLDATAKKEWERLLPILRSMGVLSAGDATALTMYCVAFSHWAEAETNIAANGLVLQDNLGRDFANPAVAISKQAGETAAKFIREFGLTPSARSAIKAAPGEDSGADDDIERFKARRKAN